MKTYVLMRDSELYAYTHDKKILKKFLDVRKNLNLIVQKQYPDTVGREYDMYKIENFEYGEVKVLSNSHEECIIDDIAMFLEGSELMDIAKYPYTLFHKKILPSLDLVMYTLHSALHDDLEALPPWDRGDTSYLYGIKIGEVYIDKFLLLVRYLSDPEFEERFRK